YVIARAWTPARIADLAKDANGEVEVRIQPAGIPAPSVSARTGKITVAVPCAALEGRPVAAVLLRSSYPMATQVRQTFDLSLLLFLVGTIVTLLAVGLALTRWVGRPLATITNALGQEDPSL